MSKILFIRHGESVDDLTNQYGNWADFPLTPTGEKQIESVSEHFFDLQQKHNFKFEKVLSSPLSRASGTGRIIANKLSLPLEEYVYLKEMNGYGLLSGMEKAYAKQKYPELVAAKENGYIPGAEPIEKFQERVKFAVSELESRQTDLVAVTHGGFMRELFEQILGKKYIKAGDGGFVLVEKREIVTASDIDFE